MPEISVDGYSDDERFANTHLVTVHATVWKPSTQVVRMFSLILSCLRSGHLSLAARNRFVRLGLCGSTHLDF
jgi:hypothetical protein